MSGAHYIDAAQVGKLIRVADYPTLPGEAYVAIKAEHS